VHEQVLAFHQLLRHRVLVYLLLPLLLDVLLVLVKDLVPLFAEVGRLAVNDEVDSVFELVGGAGVDSGVEEAQLADVEVGDLEFVPDRPLLFLAAEDDDGVELGDEGHELSPDASIQEDGGYLGVEHERLVDEVLVGDGCEVEFALLDEDPLVLLDGEAVDEVEVSVLVFYLNFLHDLPAQVDIDDFIPAQPDYEAILLLIIFLVEADVVED